MYSVQCALCVVHCALFIVQCAVGSVQCAVCSLHCAMGNVQCRVKSLELSMLSLLSSVCSKEYTALTWKCRVNIFLQYDIYSVHYALQWLVELVSFIAVWDTLQGCGWVLLNPLLGYCLGCCRELLGELRRLCCLRTVLLPLRHIDQTWNKKTKYHKELSFKNWHNSSENR